MTNPLINIWRSLPWRRALLIGLGALLSYLLIPLGFIRYDDTKTLRDARLARAVKFGDKNAEFNSKVNAAATLLRMYGSHNDRVRLTASQLPEARKALYEKYLERRLDLDEVAWWWTSEFEREAAALDLLSFDELNQLHTEIDNYKKSVLTTVNQVTYLWHFLESPEYRVNEESRKNRKDLEGKTQKELENEFNARNEVVKKVVLLFSKSEYRTGTFDLISP